MGTYKNFNEYFIDNYNFLVGEWYVYKRTVLNKIFKDKDDRYFREDLFMEMCRLYYHNSCKYNWVAA